MEPVGQDPDEFCRAIRRRLVGSMVLFCGDRDVAEELAQEALARAIERWSRVSRYASPEAWTYRTAFNLARSRARRRAAERCANERYAQRSRPAALPDTPTALALRDAVRALPARQREAVVARFYAGMSVDEAADALRCAPGTVKALTHQAVVRLRAAGLIDELDEEPAQQKEVRPDEVVG